MLKSNARFTLQAVAIGLVGLAMLGAQAQADDKFDGSVEIINKSGTPIVAVIDSGSRGEGANVKKYPSIMDKLGLMLETGKADTISKSFKVGDEITIHIYEVKNGRPTREASSKKFASITLDIPPDITKNFHIEWDGSVIKKK